MVRQVTDASSIQCTFSTTSSVGPVSGDVQEVDHQFVGVYAAELRVDRVDLRGAVNAAPNGTANNGSIDNSSGADR